jgi:hypothetical protein
MAGWIVSPSPPGASIVHNIYKPDMVSSELPLSPPPCPRTHTVRRNACLLTSLDFFILQTLPPVDTAEGVGGSTKKEK